ncbi:MAG: hypothetical protein QM687_08435 [Ferruginibacter sp.]
MCSGSKWLLCLLATVVFCADSFAQNTTSPYSILGIGDIETKDFGRFFATGNAATARREAYSYNFSNPASLTALPYKTMNMDFAFRGKASNFNSPYSDTGATAINKDFSIKRVSVAFKVTEKAAFAFGLRPFSTVNYQYSNYNNITDGNATIYKLTEGEGGINQVYFSYARTLAKGLNAGITGSWLFGGITRNNTYASVDADLSMAGKFQEFYYGAGATAGLQYEAGTNKKVKHQFGLTASVYQKLKGEFTSSYSDATGILKEETTNSSFKMPMVFNAGYAATFKNLYTFALEGQFSKWDYQKLNYSNSYVDNSFKIGAGFEYAPKLKQSNYTVEKFYLGAGINYERSYMVINNHFLNDLSVSFGGGYNISRILYMHGALEAGRKGSTSVGQYSENYMQFVLGFTLKDIWLGSKKFGRYQ